MSFAQDLFNYQKTYTAHVQKNIGGYVDGKQQPEEWEDVGVYTCVFYRGSAGVRITNDQLRTRVSAVCLIDPAKLVLDDVTISDDMQISILNGSEQLGLFRVVLADDIAYQGEILQILLEEIRP